MCGVALCKPSKNECWVGLTLMNGLPRKTVPKEMS